MTNNKNSGKVLFYLQMFVCILFLFSCNTTKKTTKESYIYFQSGLDSIRYVQTREPVIQNNDLLSIQISSTSLNQDQTLPFKTPTSSSAANSGWMVSTTGNINMPVIGVVKAAGLTLVQLQNAMTEKLLPFVKDPSVIIHFLQFKVNVLGQVKSPGTKSFEVDRVTIIDAISAAGDLTDQGKRDDITVIREEGNQRKVYKVDIRSGGIFQSPGYLLQPNDILYIGATEQKFKTLQSEASVGTYNVLRVVTTILGLATSILFFKSLL